MTPHEEAGPADAATAEALKLAGEILSAKGDVPFEARAEALAVQGLWTEALNSYVDGIRPYISQERAAVLTAIVQGHPALKRPTLLTVADPLEAEKHYAAGLQWWNDREYDQAEKEFFTAVEATTARTRGTTTTSACRGCCRATATPSRTSSRGRGWNGRTDRPAPP